MEYMWSVRMKWESVLPVILTCFGLVAPSFDVQKLQISIGESFFFLLFCVIFLLSYSQHQQNLVNTSNVFYERTGIAISYELQVVQKDQLIEEMIS